MIELTKAQKKAARILIDRALQRECERFLVDVKHLVNTRCKRIVLTKGTWNCIRK